MDTRQPTPDPLEQFLAGLPVSPPDSSFQARLLQMTLKSLRRQRWRKRAAAIGALAASFLAGAVCIHLLPARIPDQGRQEQAGAHVPREKAATAVVPERPEEKKAARLPGGDAVVMEWNAFDEPNRREVLYRQAGDLYVQENHDYEAALRCYAQALENNSDQDLTITPDDNWLVMALKEARRKEQSHAKKAG